MSQRFARLPLAMVMCLGAITTLSMAQSIRGLKCADSTDTVDLDLWSTRSLVSPNGEWKFTSTGPMSAYRTALLTATDTRTGEQWSIGSLERDGTAFWSRDSERLLLEDEYAADDTKIRVFDFSNSIPKEIKGIDPELRKAIFAHISDDQTILWLTYPRVCFLSHDSSKIVLTADAPHAPKTGGSGTGLKLIFAVDLGSLKVHEINAKEEH